MRAMLAISQRELLILRKRFFRQLASMSVSPLLYLFAFGFGMGRGVRVGGHSYLEFLIPGLVAMNRMIQAFAIASEINILAVGLNSFVFASLAVGLAMLVKSHSDQAPLTNFFITPMAFLGGTFSPMDTMPGWVQHILHFLPLTHASKAIRAAAFGNPPDFSSYMLLALLGAVFFVLAFHWVNRARD